VSPDCPFCERDQPGRPSHAYVSCAHPCFRSILSSQPGGDYAYYALGIDINVGFPTAGDVMDIDRAIVAILEQYYVLVDGVWFAETTEIVQAAHREIREYLASLEVCMIV
jgi:hypothetical protein